MSSTTDLIDRYKARKHLTSDAELGRALDLKPSSVSNYRQGVRHAEPEIVKKIAAELGEDAEVWVLRVQAERETVPARKKVWLRCVERLSSVALITITTFGLLHTSSVMETSSGFLRMSNLIDIAHVSAAVACALLASTILGSRREQTAVR